MELTNIKDLFREKEKYQGRKVTVGGWVRSNRDSKNFGFLVVNDGTFFEPLQIVYSSEMPGFAEAARIGVGAASENEYLPGGFPRSFPGGVCHP